MRYEDLAPKIQDLKRQDRNDEALVILEKWMDATEAESRRDDQPVESWPYEQACVVLRKLKRYQDEIKVIERFLGQRSSGSKQSNNIVERLEKACKLAGLIEVVTVDGVPVAYYKPEGVPLDERALFVHDTVLLDTETTGLTNSDEVIELAVLRLRYSHYSGRILNVVDGYTGRREPGCPMSHQAGKVHGITLGELAGCCLDFPRIRTIVDGSRMILAHNASFDKRMAVKLMPELDRLPWYCTMSRIDWVGKGCASRKQSDVCAHYGIDYDAHSADGDIRAMLDLLMLVDDQTGRPILHELIRDVPLGYVSSWQAQHGLVVDEGEEDVEDYGATTIVITLGEESQWPAANMTPSTPPDKKRPWWKV